VVEEEDDQPMPPPPPSHNVKQTERARRLMAEIAEVLGIDQQEGTDGTASGSATGAKTSA
jgi:hypothetical protein